MPQNPFSDSFMANFGESPECELRRIPIPRTRVNRLPVNAPNPSKWHHAHSVDLVRNVGWHGGEVSVSEAQEKNKAIVRRFLEETVKENLDVVDELVSPDFVDLSLQPGQEPDREGFKR